MTQERLPENEYIWDDRAPSFRQVGKIACILASKFGVEIDADDPTPERWQQLMALLREFDTYCDDYHGGDVGAVAVLKDYDQLEAVYPAFAQGAIETDKRECMVGRVEHILNIGHAFSVSSGVRHAIALRRQEAHETAELLADCASDAVQHHPRFQNKVLPQLRDMSEAACMMDTVLDMRRDYELGKTEIPPNREYYTAFCAASVPPMVRCMGRVGISPRLTEEFFIMSKNRLSNRLRQGAQEYSSMHNMA